MVAVPAVDAQVAITNDKVAFSGEADPYGGLLPRQLKPFKLLDDGGLLFHQDDATVSRVYSGTYAGTVKRLANGAKATGNRLVTDFLLTDASEAGDAVVMGYDSDGHRNVYLLSGATLKTLALENADAASQGLFTFFYDPALDTKGHVVFKADTTSDMGIFYVSAGAAMPTPAKVAVLDNPAPEGGTFTLFSHQVSVGTMLDGRVVVFFNASTTDGMGNDGSGFYAAVVGGAGPAAVTRVADGLHEDFTFNRVGQAVYRDATALYLADVNGSTVIAAKDDAEPGGSLFGIFGEAAINDAGAVVFQASTEAGLAGLYAKTSAGLALVAAEGQVVGNETLKTFGTPQINQQGLILFSAEVTRGGNPATSLYLSDGTSLLRVVGTEDSVAGSTIQASALDGSLILRPRSLNVHGQVAFSAKLANGKEGVFIATPTSHLRAGGPGLWDEASTWDFRILPGPDTPIVADSTADAVLQGPSGVRKVRSVKVGGGTMTTTLRVQPGSTLTVPKGVTLADKGVLAGSATIAGNLTMGPGSRLALNLAGSTRPTYEFLKVTGTATLGGTLAVTKSGGFEPTRGQIFDLLDLTKRVGTFADITSSLPLLTPAGQTWDSSKLYTAGWLTVSGATLFAPVAGVFTGTFEGNPTASTTSGSLQLTLAGNGMLSGSIYYAGRRYTVPAALLNVDGARTITFGLPKKTLQVQVATVNQLPQLTATVSNGAVQESQSVAARANPAFPAKSPLVGHYTIALPPDAAHPEATFPQGTGYAKVTVTTRGLATIVGVLGDGTPFSTGGPVTAGGELPFYFPLYSLKGLIAGKLVLHSSAPSDPVEGSFRWLKPEAATGKFKSLIDATVTVFGSGYRNPVAPAKVLTFVNDTATFHAVGGNVGLLPSKQVVLGTAYAFKSTTSEPFAFTLSAATFGLGSGTFRDAANKPRTMKGVVLQKQNSAVGLLIGTDQNGAFDID